VSRAKARYCKGCWYDLRGCASHVCPECGQRFNPDKPTTYSKYPGTRLPNEVWFVLVCHVLALILLAAGPIIARLGQDYKLGWHEAVAVSMVCTSLPLFGVAAFYGLCVVFLYARKLKPVPCAFLYLIGLSPSLSVLAGLLYMFVFVAD